MIESVCHFVLSGSISGTIAAFFTNPFDVGKTRIQITMQENEKISHPNMFKYLYKIYKNEGMGHYMLDLVLV